MLDARECLGLDVQPRQVVTSHQSQIQAELLHQDPSLSTISSGRSRNLERACLSRPAACGGLTNAEDRAVHFLHIVSRSPRGPVIAAKRDGPCRVATLSGRPAT